MKKLLISLTFVLSIFLTHNAIAVTFVSGGGGDICAPKPISDNSDTTNINACKDQCATIGLTATGQWRNINQGNVCPSLSICGCAAKKL